MKIEEEKQQPSKEHVTETVDSWFDGAGTAAAPENATSVPLQVVQTDTQVAQTDTAHVNSQHDGRESSRNQTNNTILEGGQLRSQYSISVGGSVLNLEEHVAILDNSVGQGSQGS